MAYVAAAVGVLIAGAVIDSNDAGGLGGRQVWLYVTILTLGYMVSRGPAKSGSRDPTGIATTDPAGALPAAAAAARGARRKAVSAWGAP